MLIEFKKVENGAHITEDKRGRLSSSGTFHISSVSINPEHVSAIYPGTPTIIEGMGNQVQMLTKIRYGTEEVIVIGSEDEVKRKLLIETDQRILLKG